MLFQLPPCPPHKKIFFPLNPPPSNPQKTLSPPSVLRASEPSTSRSGLSVKIWWRWLFFPSGNWSFLFGFQGPLPLFCFPPPVPSGAAPFYPLVASPGCSTDCSNVQIIDRMCKSDTDLLHWLTFPIKLPVRLWVLVTQVITSKCLYRLRCRAQ